MKKTIAASLLLILLAACASKPLPQADARVGTDLTPFRSIPAYIECGDCRMP